MKLLFKQRLFSWFDSYDIFGENGETIYTVEGQLAWGHTLHISNAQGEHIGTLKQQLLTLLPKFEIILRNVCVGTITQEFRLFTPAFNVDYSGWRVEGDFWGFAYRIYDSNNDEVASAEKQFFNFTDTYIIDVRNQENALQALIVVLAIDAARFRQR